jgi:hypothetical protein
MEVMHQEDREIFYLRFPTSFFLILSLTKISGKWAGIVSGLCINAALTFYIECRIPVSLDRGVSNISAKGPLGLITVVVKQNQIRLVAEKPAIDPR